MTPDQARQLVEAFGLSCDGLKSCSIEITNTQLSATCVYLRRSGTTAETATEVVRRFNLHATPVDRAEGTT